MNQGLTHQQTKELLLRYGKNRIESHTTSSAWQMFFEQFPTVINAILAIAALLSFFLNNILDASFILAIIVLNAVFGFIQEYRAERSLAKLQSYTAPTARVIRENKESKILAEDLVPGDIAVLSEGDRVPADGVLIEVTHLEIDESILTGESLAVNKKKPDAVFLGTLAIRGKGIIRVTKTGMYTKFGNIAQTLSAITDDKTLLQKKLDQLGKVLSFGAIIAGLTIIPIGLFYHNNLLQLVLVSASIGIAAIPEGLPAVITIAFAVGTHRMAKRSAIVRKMAAIETLGAMQFVLVDKTGTITQNAMRVKTFWLSKRSLLPRLIQACILGNTATLAEKGNGQFDIIGDQTDGALLLWAKQQNTFRIPPVGHLVDEYIFDSNTKTITTIWKNNDKQYAFIRGAPETIIAKSKLSQKEKENVTKRFEAFAKEGLRTIAFAVQTDTSFTFLGFLGIYDPPRAEIKDAIEKARTAGVAVSMVTGDNELTALAIAKDIGLISKDEDVITGDELAKLSDEALVSVLRKTRVFARTQPEQKLRLVSLLKQQGLVVGVTGDGVNDALALKKADVGIAMGTGGTDVAREASDIVLADNNFATLVKAIEEGRMIYKNITNAIVYLLSGNLAEISLVFFATLFHMPFPLLPTQILWINLITDSLPALALATGSHDASVLSKKPRNPARPILHPRRILLICIVGFAMSGALLLLFHVLLQTTSEAKARTVVFNLLIYFHLVIVGVIGRHSVAKGNLFLILTIVIIFLLQVLITFTPFFQHIFHLAI